MAMQVEDKYKRPLEWVPPPPVSKSRKSEGSDISAPPAGGTGGGGSSGSAASGNGGAGGASPAAKLFAKPNGGNKGGEGAGDRGKGGKGGRGANLPKDPVGRIEHVTTMQSKILVRHSMELAQVRKETQLVVELSSNVEDLRKDLQYVHHKWSAQRETG